MTLFLSRSNQPIRCNQSWYCQAQPQSHLQLGRSWFYSKLLGPSGEPTLRNNTFWAMSIRHNMTLTSKWSDQWLDPRQIFRPYSYHSWGPFNHQTIWIIIIQTWYDLDLKAKLVSHNKRSHRYLISHKSSEWVFYLLGMDFTFTQSVTGAIQPYSNPKNIFKSAQSLIWPWPQSKNVSINGVILEIPSDPNLISHRAITPVLATKQSGVI